MKTAIFLASALVLSLGGGPAMAKWDSGSSRSSDNGTSGWGSGGNHGSYGNKESEHDKYDGHKKKRFGKKHEPKEEPPEPEVAEEPTDDPAPVERVRFNNDSSGGCSSTDFIRSSGKDCNEDSND